MTAQLSGQAPGFPSTKNGEWPYYTADVKGSRYSPLDQINAGNFNQLEVAWRFKTDNLGTRPEFKLEGTPLMVKGMVFATGGTRRSVVALDAQPARCCGCIASKKANVPGVVAPARGAASAVRRTGRRADLLCDHRIPARAVDAKTGDAVAGFGNKGVIDLKQDDDQLLDPITSDVAWNGAPVVAKDVVLIGAAHRAGGAPRSRANAKGYIRGFDARTGKRLWIFHTIPQLGEFGNDTWLKDSWSYTGHTGLWGQMTVERSWHRVPAD